jgi:hypothetical protein
LTGSATKEWAQVDFAVFGADEFFVRAVAGYLIPARVFADRKSFDDMVNLAHASIPREAHFSQDDAELRPLSWRSSMLWTLRFQAVSLAAVAVAIAAVMLVRG